MARKTLISAKEALAVLITTSMVFGAVALAADTGTVAATVTAQKVSVTVSDGSVAYGTIPLGSAKDTTAGGVNDTQTVKNDGNIAEDFNVRGINSGNWMLGAAAGADTFVHDYCVTGSGTPDLCDASPVWNHLSSGSVGTLATNIAAAGTQKFDLKVTMPTTTSNYAEQSINVTVQAVAH